jgi:hypothetical protein
MAVLDSSLRKQLERTVVSARTTAESAADKALKRLGMHQHEPPSTLSPDERAFRRELAAQKSQLANYQALVEQCAYEHWHRILFARFLAENELLIHPTAGVAVSLEDCDDAELQAEFGASDAYDLAARYAAQMLPAVFRPDDALLRVKLAPEDRIALEKLVRELPETVFKADDSLGWTYQFWQKERKTELKRAGKPIGGTDICAVTQVFTEHYMVRFLLENTLGAWWVHHSPSTKLHHNWAYFKTDIRHDIRSFPQRLSEVTFMDPCCGSGHFLVEAFLMLHSMYCEQGMSSVEAGDAAILHNLRGLELDPRCTQIAVFNVALAAWRNGGFRELPPIRVACTGLPLKGTRNRWENLARKEATLAEGMALLHDTFSMASDIGSLLHPASMFDVHECSSAVNSSSQAAAPDHPTRSSDSPWHRLEPLLKRAVASEPHYESYFAGVRALGISEAAQMLADSYWITITSPPFLSSGNFVAPLKEFCSERFPSGKADLATCFVTRCLTFTHPNGLCALVNKDELLFLKAYTGLREDLLRQTSLVALVRFGEGAFESATAAGAFTCNIMLSKREPTVGAVFFGVDISDEKGPAAKAEALASATLTLPDSRFGDADDIH